jgi:hypothetical protein
VHLIGEVKGAFGFDTDRLFCKVRCYGDLIQP